MCRVGQQVGSGGVCPATVSCHQMHRHSNGKLEVGLAKGG